VVSRHGHHGKEGKQDWPGKLLTRVIDRRDDELIASRPRSSRRGQALNDHLPPLPNYIHDMNRSEKRISGNRKASDDRRLVRRWASKLVMPRPLISALQPLPLLSAQEQNQFIAGPLPPSRGHLQHVGRFPLLLPDTLKVL
jgi:hypothetical protein